MKSKIFINKFLTPLFTLLLIFSCSKYQVDPSLVHGQLDNGFSYFVYSNPKPKESLSLRLVVKSGSVHEAEDQQGIAHFLEHLAFNGTKDFPGDQIVKELESMGVKYGAHLNAYTSYDHTVYEIELPLDNSDNFDKGLKIIRDWADGLLILDEEVEKEREIILQEKRDRKSAFSKMYDKMLPLLFENSVYANRRPIGVSSIIKKVPASRIRDFYHDYYQPYRMALFAVGDMPTNQVVKQIKKYFNDFGQAPAPITPSEWEQKEQEFLTIKDNDKSHFLLFSDKELDRCSFYQINRVPSKKFESPLAELEYDLTYALASAIIDQHLNQKFNDQEAQSKSIVSSYTSSLGYARHKNFHLTGFNLEQTKILEGYKEGYGELCKFLKEGATSSQLAQQKSRILKNLEDEVNNQKHKNNQQIISSLYGHYLSDNLMPDSRWILKKGKKILSQIDLAQVNKMIQSIADTKNRVIVLFYPEGSATNSLTVSELEDSINEIQNQIMDAAKESEKNEEDLKELEINLEKSTGKIESRKKIDYLKTTKYLLSNKLTVYSRPSSLSKNNLNIYFYSKGGTSLASDENFPNAELADDLFYYSCLANLNRVEKNLWLERNGINLNLSIDEMEESFSISGTFSKASEIFSLIVAIFTQINSTNEDFNYTKSNYINYATNFDNDPTNWFSKQINQLLRNKGHRDPQIDAAAARKTNYQATFDFLKSRFADASDFVCIITGNYPPKKLEQFLVSHLATLPSDFDNTNNENFLPVFNQYPKSNSAHRYKKNQEEQALVYQLFHTSQKWDLKLNLELQAATSILTRVFDREIREKESGTYSIGAFGAIRKEPFEELLGGIVFSCNPSRLEELSQKTKDCLNRFLEDNWDEVLLDNFKKSSILSDKENRQKDSYWSSLILEEALGLSNKEEFDSRLDRINSLTREDINSATKLLFNQSYSTEAILLPIN